MDGSTFIDFRLKRKVKLEIQFYTAVTVQQHVFQHTPHSGHSIRFIGVAKLEYAFGTDSLLDSL